MTIVFSNITRRHLEVTIRWLEKIRAPNCWDLSFEEVARLLGIDEEAYVDVLRRIECGNDFSLSNESLERLSLLLGIWKMLKVLAPACSEDFVVAAFKDASENSNFGGRSIRTHLLESTNVDDFYRIRFLLGIDPRANN